MRGTAELYLPGEGIPRAGKTQFEAQPVPISTDDFHNLVREFRDKKCVVAALWDGPARGYLLLNRTANPVTLEQAVSYLTERLTPDDTHFFETALAKGIGHKNKGKAYLGIGAYADTGYGQQLLAYIFLMRPDEQSYKS